MVVLCVCLCVSVCCAVKKAKLQGPPGKNFLYSQTLFPFSVHFTLHFTNVHCSQLVRDLYAVKLVGFLIMFIGVCLFVYKNKNV